MLLIKVEEKIEKHILGFQ